MKRITSLAVFLFVSLSTDCVPPFMIGQATSRARSDQSELPSRNGVLDKITASIKALASPSPQTKEYNSTNTEVAAQLWKNF